MSAGDNMDITCGCGHHFSAWVWQSANVTLSPELRKRILDGDMNVVKCPSCGSRFHVEIPFLYHDMTGREWIWVYPLSYEQESGTVRDKVMQMWNKLKGSMPAEVTEAFEKEYTVLVLFGMDALVYYLQSKQGGDDVSSN